jgi:hypothetical protein
MAATKLFRVKFEADLAQATTQGMKFAKSQQQTVQELRKLKGASKAASDEIKKVAQAQRELNEAQSKGTGVVTKDLNAWQEWVKRNETAGKKLETFKSGLRGLSSEFGSFGVLLGDVVGSLGAVGVGLGAVMIASRELSSALGANKKRAEEMRKELRELAKQTAEYHKLSQQAAGAPFQQQQQVTARVAGAMGLSKPKAKEMIVQTAKASGLQAETVGRLAEQAGAAGVGPKAAKQLIEQVGKAAVTTGQVGGESAIMGRMLKRIGTGFSPVEARQMEQAWASRPPAQLSVRDELRAKAMEAEGMSRGEARRKVFREGVERGGYRGQWGVAELDPEARKLFQIRQTQAAATAEPFRQAGKLAGPAAAQARETLAAARYGGTAELGYARQDLEAKRATAEWKQKHPYRDVKTATESQLTAAGPITKLAEIALNLRSGRIQPPAQNIETAAPVWRNEEDYQQQAEEVGQIMGQHKMNATMRDPQLLAGVSGDPLIP